MKIVWLWIKILKVDIHDLLRRLGAMVRVATGVELVLKASASVRVQLLRATRSSIPSTSSFSSSEGEFGDVPAFRSPKAAIKMHELCALSIV